MYTIKKQEKYIIIRNSLRKFSYFELERTSYFKMITFNILIFFIFKANETKLILSLYSVLSIQFKYSSNSTNKKINNLNLSFLIKTIKF